MEHAVLKTDTGHAGPMLMFNDTNSDPSGCWYVGGSTSDAYAGPGGQPAGGKARNAPSLGAGHTWRGCRPGPAPSPGVVHSVWGALAGSRWQAPPPWPALRTGQRFLSGGWGSLGGRGAPALGRRVHRVPVLAPGRPRRPAGATAAGRLPGFQPTPGGG
jgi:hypothetical protein